MTISWGASVHGVIFFETDDPEHNTQPPAGDLADSGWQYMGFWGAFTGVPIADNLFITAKHVGGTVGDSLTFQDVDYLTIESFADPDSDLRIWKICGQLPEQAQLYTLQDEAGKALVVFGRGTQRGPEVTISNLTGEESKGWQWGPADGLLRWGQNRVTEIVEDPALSPILGGSDENMSPLLKAEFNADGEPNEAHLSTGDSGGAVFIQEGGEWKLAGINFAVDGPYNTSSSGAGFNAAVFDEGGLYKGGEGNWSQQPDAPVIDLPGSFYATRISSNLEWINSIIDLHAGDTALPEVHTASQVEGPYALQANATLLDDNRFALPIPEETEFYQMKSCQPVEIIGIDLTDNQLVLEFR